MADDILIVDDEKDIRSLLSMTLEDEGYATLQAANADEARTALLAQPPKLAILDIWMRDSDMDGIELLGMGEINLSVIASANDFRAWHD